MIETIKSGPTQEQIVGFLAEAQLRYGALEAAKAAAREAQAAVREANKAIRTLRKMIQRTGVDLLEFDVLRTDANLQPKALEAKDAERGRWREWAGIKSTIIIPPKEEAQPFQFAAAPEEETVTPEDAERVKAMGYRAGMDGKGPQDNPYLESSKKGQIWLDAARTGAMERRLKQEADASQPDRRPFRERVTRAHLLPPGPKFLAAKAAREAAEKAAAEKAENAAD